MTATIRVPGTRRRRVRMFKLPRFVETNAGEILNIWKAENAWNQAERDGDAKANDRVVQVALRWLAAPPKIIPEPDIGHHGRKSEKYFNVWAQTREGRKRIQSWTRVFPGLNYERNFPRFQIQRFLRELLTTGTILNKRIRTGRRGITKLFNRAGDAEFASEISDEIEMILQEEDCSFDNDFPVVGHNEMGEPIYHFVPGRENSILSKRLYTLGRVGYYDIKPSKKKREEAKKCASSLGDLPDELKVMIVRSLFKLDADIQVILRRPGQAAPPFKYNFFLWGLGDALDGAPPPTRSGTEVGQIKNMFALAGVNREFRGLVMQVLYGENKFAFGPFRRIEGVPNRKMYHFGHWKNAIGW
ncbi:hypothetical protein FB567DRAFT_633217 [Paraphoma chrysanthemicola]|uniref:Uncharacterized protein n=1 Tax=Paraphoma chrysanthemicola TaxID=798071 RepID=A0A8K0VU11_9PLEO|nr:hypothetical protein FB567DRAFT_633217 [Paraphoma chrysanthemicola]